MSENKLGKSLHSAKKIGGFYNKKYMMHKYWGKKPAKELRELIYQFSKEGDLLLDPFAGYGGFSSEAILANRNVISNDLNPSANFINQVLLSYKIDFSKLHQYIKIIEEESKDLRDYWYSFKYQDNDYEIVSALRTKNGELKKLKISQKGKRNHIEIEIDSEYINSFSELEKEFRIEDWYPKNKLIANSRISAKNGMSVDSLFDKRSLSGHSKLFAIISSFPDSEEKDVLLLAFTANLANCSKLVPPIKSRGEMAAGAWMTGYYIGETYLENNVFHYFENRLKKVISGKEEYINQYFDLFAKGKYEITNQNAKKLNIPSESIDFIFTDFPYGDAVPYFEQSLIWNSWLGYFVDYENEIVVSNSNDRNKGKDSFRDDISQAIFEGYRVLKKDKYFIFTYHSLSGFEWVSITNALIKSGFIIEDCELLVQKTFTPRQLNRSKTIRGDLLVVCKKSKDAMSYFEFSSEKQDIILKNLLRKVIEEGAYETNDVVVQFLKEFFASRMIITEDNIIAKLEEVSKFDGKGWRLD